MKRIAVGTMVVAMSLLGSTADVGAGPFPQPDFDIDPTSGPAGTTITAEGNCYALFPSGTPSGLPSGTPDAPAGLSSSTVEVEISRNGNTLDSVQAPAASDGSWSVEVTVPPGTSAGDVDVDAACTVIFEEIGPRGSRAMTSVDSPAGGGNTFPYLTQIFTVTAQPTTTGAAPTTTVASTSTTAPAVAAQAVRSQPAFTG